MPRCARARGRRRGRGAGEAGTCPALGSPAPGAGSAAPWPPSRCGARPGRGGRRGAHGQGPRASRSALAGEGEWLPAAAVAVAAAAAAGREVRRGQLHGGQHPPPPTPRTQRDPVGAGVGAPPWAEVLRSSFQGPGGTLCPRSCLWTCSSGRSRPRVEGGGHLDAAPPRLSQPGDFSAVWSRDVGAAQPRNSLPGGEPAWSQLLSPSGVGVLQFQKVKKPLWGWESLFCCLGPGGGAGGCAEEVVQGEAQENGHLFLGLSLLWGLCLIPGRTGYTPYLRVPEHWTGCSGPSGSHSPLCRAQHQLTLALALPTSCSSCPDLSRGVSSESLRPRP
ncbi:spidroin-2-like [Canis lupus dingo]|uniref:spidroin-2-like n=1 Tax=Canis lupus dingo TaxID=286419 RepID=UPI0020C55E93|nr:spidroin-2-like [Canis lupus dingo]